MFKISPPMQLRQRSRNIMEIILRTLLLLCLTTCGAVSQDNITEPVIVIIGGAYSIRNAHISLIIKGIQLATNIGYQKLIKGGSSIDAVEEVIRSLELDENFNAGYGASLRLDGQIAMEASIMDGSDLSAGSVSGIRDILHPISLARKAKDTVGHNFIYGDAAKNLAKQYAFQILTPGALVTKRAFEALKSYNNGVLQTQSLPASIGAVAIDKLGNIAAGTVSGGIVEKLPATLSESSIVGAGIYADNQLGGVVTSGHGSSIIKYGLAHRILQQLSHSAGNVKAATEDVIKDMTQRFNQTAGAVTLDKSGNVGISFTTRRMAWGYRKGHCFYYGINKRDQNVECAENNTSQQTNSEIQLYSELSDLVTIENIRKK